MAAKREGIGSFPQLCPRGLSRDMAAAYLNLGCTLFDELVEAGDLPKPKRIRRRRIWDRYALDQAFEALDADDIDEVTKAKQAWEDRLKDKD